MNGFENVAEAEDTLIRFIDINILKELDEFPRCPDQTEGLTCKLTEINRDESLMIFISHCWLRGNSQCEGWDGRPHPDNESNEKLRLCIEGSEKVWKDYAPKMKFCYLWIDYCCIDQYNEVKISNTLKRYDTIVEHCDSIITPITGKIIFKWTNDYNDYKSPYWNGDSPQAYLNRAWCRCEMMYATHIPLKQNTNNTNRMSLFQGDLYKGYLQNRRAHFIYGDFDCKSYDISPCLPPLHYGWYEEYNPLKGLLSVSEDIVKVQRLVDGLQQYMFENGSVLGYKGDRNEKGEKHGKGVETFYQRDYMKYTGEFKNNQRDGYGVTTDRFKRWTHEGEWKNDRMNGPGIFCDGSHLVFIGNYYNDKKEGLGIEGWSNGQVFAGEWKNDSRKGPGSVTDADGRVTEGMWRNNNLVSKGPSTVKPVYREVLELHTLKLHIKLLGHVSRCTRCYSKPFWKSNVRL